MGQACGFIKNQPMIILPDGDGVAVDFMATSLLEVRWGDVVVVDGNSLNKIAHVALSNLFIERAMVAGGTIIHNISAGQKATVLEWIHNRIMATHVTHVIYRDAKDLETYKRTSRVWGLRDMLFKIGSQLASLRVQLFEAQQSMAEYDIHNLPGDE
jgi:hypothetical protein